MQATPDTPASNAELNEFYGVEKSHTTRNLIIETITKTVRSVDHRALSVPYVKYNENGHRNVEAYRMIDVVKDYANDPKPLKALMAVLAGSDCPLVAKWREAIAERYADANADEVDEVAND